MVIAHWYLQFDTGERRQSTRVYSSKQTAARYLRDYLIRHYVATRWEEGAECVEFGYSVREGFESPVTNGEYDFTAKGSRLFHNIYEEVSNETKSPK